MTSRAPPQAPLKLIRMMQKGSRGETAQEWHYQRLESGLWGVTHLIPNPVRPTIGMLRQTIAIHGLAELAWLDESSPYTINQPRVAIDQAFRPFAINNTLRARHIGTVTELGGNIVALITLSPGVGFSFSRSFETATKIPGEKPLSTQIKKATGSNTISCTTTATPETAATLHLDLKGAFLRLICNTEGREGSTERAFLLDSGVAILVSATFADGHTEPFIITEVHYSQ